MSNPLFSMMKGMNNMSPFGNNPVSMLMNGGNPQQILMSMLQQQNPQAYQQVQEMMRVGKNPKDVIKQLTSTMDQSQIAYIMQMANRFGIK